jgi:hypothetical protein
MHSSRRQFSEVADEWRATWDQGPKTRVGYESILRYHLTGDGGRFTYARLEAITTKRDTGVRQTS